MNRKETLERIDELEKKIEYYELQDNPEDWDLLMSLQEQLTMNYEWLNGYDNPFEEVDW